MGKRILNRREVLEQLDLGNPIHWWTWGGYNFHMYIDNRSVAIRHDTIVKLTRENLLTSWGVGHGLTGTIRLKGKNK